MVVTAELLVAAAAVEAAVAVAVAAVAAKVRAPPAPAATIVRAGRCLLKAGWCGLKSDGERWASAREAAAVGTSWSAWRLMPAIQMGARASTLLVLCAWSALCPQLLLRRSSAIGQTMRWRSARGRQWRCLAWWRTAWPAGQGAASARPCCKRARRACRRPPPGARQARSRRVR